MTLAVLTLFIVNGLMSVSVSSDLTGAQAPTISSPSNTIAETPVNVSIPYVDTHYGYADGIIDPTEYAFNFSDPTTGVSLYMEHNETFLYVGLQAQTSGWVALAWKNPGDNYTTAGVDGADMIIGYAPGTPHALSYPVVENTSVVRAKYTLYARNGTMRETGYAPDGSGDTPLYKAGLLNKYVDGILGMRVGETRHFIIPAEYGYPEGHELYGEDLEFVVTIESIDSDTTNPASNSAIAYYDASGTNTFSHSIDLNQSRIIAANASDDGSTTTLEYVLRLNSTDLEDISLSNFTEAFPFVTLIGQSESLSTLPNSHTSWSSPLSLRFVPNSAPVISTTFPKENDVLDWLVTLKLNATDDTIVRTAAFRVDNESWTQLKYNFQTDLWEYAFDVSDYESGSQHVLWFNATDGANSTSVISVNVTFVIPYNPAMGMTLTMSHKVTTLMYHSTKIEDEFTVKNEEAVPITSLEFYLPSPFTNNFLSVEAQDSRETPLEVSRLPDVNDMFRWRVYLSEPVEVGESYTFKVTIYLHSLHILTDFDNELYDITCLKYPVVPYIISRLSVSIGLRSGDNMQGGNNPEGVYYNIAPLTIETFKIVISSVTPLIIGTRTTKITVDPWGWLHYEETVYIENVGPAKELDIAMTFPAYMSNVKIYDDVGILAGSQPTDYDWNSTLRQRINLRTDRFGEVGFWPGYKYTFHAKYDLYLPEYQKQTSAGLVVDFPMATLDEILFTTHTVDVVVPLGVDPVQPTDGYRLLFGVFEAVLRYNYYNTTQRNPPQISLVYNLTPAVLARPLAFALIIGFIAAIYVTTRRIEIPESKDAEAVETTATTSRQVGAPPDLLSEFARTYSRKTALNLDLEKLESSRKRGKVSKREFMTRERDIKAQLSELDSKIAKLKGELISYGSRYRDMIGQLELQEEKMEGAKAGLRQLLIRKKKQKISRAAFEKTRQDYLKTIKQAVSSIDRILLSLQEEAGEI